MRNFLKKLKIINNYKLFFIEILNYGGFFFFWEKLKNILFIWRKKNIRINKTIQKRFRAYLVGCNRYCNIIVIHIV